MILGIVVAAVTVIAIGGIVLARVAERRERRAESEIWGKSSYI